MTAAATDPQLADLLRRKMEVRNHAVERDLTMADAELASMLTVRASSRAADDLLGPC